MVKRISILLVFTSTFLGLQGQELNNIRKQIISTATDSVLLDSLSIIPSSFIAFDSLNNEINTNLYVINHAKAIFYPTKELQEKHTTLAVEYRVFPVLFDKTYSKRNYEEYLSPDSLMGRNTSRYSFNSSHETGWDDQLETQGSIMRGIRFGNNQNLSVNSSMNLTFQGDLGNDFMVEGAISDKSIPLQPEGTTRQLDEFDRIFIKVKRKDFSIRAGDIDLHSTSPNQLLTFNRNVQGLAYSGKFSTKKDTLSVTAALSAPKGKFTRNQLQGSEGNQGPYRLQGEIGEPYIIVLSGSEKVYVNGELLIRGDDQHYTIDYNAAEITFTQKMPINQNSRIQVEFEYSERSYSRFTTYASVHNKRKGLTWGIDIFSEQDSKNQPLSQELSSEQKKHLASIGDSLSKAYIAQVDTVNYDPELILYQKLDTTVNGETHSVFKYSTNPTNAINKVYFSFVGQGKGNYTPDFGTANGRVYRWVAPQNGTPQGSYEPFRRLVTPQKKQMVQASINHKWANNSYIDARYALSNTDLNTYSSLNSNDNIGHGIQLAAAHGFNPSKNDFRFAVGGNLMKTTKGFRGIDRFRPVEFERDWNIEALLSGANEQLISCWAEVSKPKKLYTKVTGEKLDIGSWYSGSKFGITGWKNTKLLNASWDASIASATNTAKTAEFIRAKVGLARTQGFINMLLQAEMENNMASSAVINNLLDKSFSWYHVKASISTPDTLAASAKMQYIFRNDYKPNNNQFELFGSSHEASVSAKGSSTKAGTISSLLGYRVFSPNTNVFPQSGKEEQTALARVEYSNKFLKGLWNMGASYELGSGLEPDMEYYFFEVPAGQGVYTWIDYNNNGVMEISEFEIANFPDEARYIRINIPGAKLINVRNNALSVRSNLNPSAIIKNTKGLPGLLSRLSNQTSFRAQQKNRLTNFWEAANPIVSNPADSQIVSLSSNIRNSIAFNRLNQRFGAEYIYIKGESKAILANGFEQKQMQSHRIVLWFMPVKKITSRTEAEEYSKNALSEYFATRNYAITGQLAQQSVKFIGLKQHSVEAVYKAAKLINTQGDEELKSHSISIISNLAFANQSSVMFTCSYVVNDFVGNQQTAVAYEMMKGLQSGKNMVWEVSARKRLSKLFELEIGYNGRYLSNGNVVHSGSMQARALF
ncbi:MAG: hypothetical protein RBR13_03075 [Tenuifilaceae bacterium]|nr:hypothetical protein [Tenuifilaceae bacterium]